MADNVDPGTIVCGNCRALVAVDSTFCMMCGRTLGGDSAGFAGPVAPPPGGFAPPTYGSPPGYGWPPAYGSGPAGPGGFGYPPVRARGSRPMIVVAIAVALIAATVAGAIFVLGAGTGRSAATLTPLIVPTYHATPTPRPSGNFSSTGALTVARYSAAATLLGDGRVLIVGGRGTAADGSTGVLASAELYDPATGKFTPTGSLTTPRAYGTATVLRDGRVLMAGGSDSCPNDVCDSLASAELYDPQAGTFSPTGSMSIDRAGHSATLLSDGRVLIVGGSDNCTASSCPLASAEIYDPNTGKFSSAGSMKVARYGSAAALLADGRVLVAGGDGSGATPTLASAEIYDPKTDKFSATGSMATARWGHTATPLEDGRVLVAGGSGISSAEIYDPKTGKFSPTDSMAATRDWHTATGLADGSVLVAGGADCSGSQCAARSTADLYNPNTGKFGPAGAMATSRDGHTATLLKDGNVLIAGGLGDNIILDSAELYLPVGTP